MTRVLCWLLCVAGIALAPSLAWGTTIRKMELPDLVSQSKLIVQGTVLQLAVVYDDGENGPQNVRTEVTIQVSKTFKGIEQPTLTVTVPGGVVDNILHKWPGYPKFELGEETIVFLHRLPTKVADADTIIPFAGTLGVTGLEQGRFQIVDDPAQGKVAKRNLGDINIVGEISGTREQAPRPLAALVKEIEQAVELKSAERE